MPFTPFSLRRKGGVNPKPENAKRPAGPQPRPRPPEQVTKPVEVTVNVNLNVYREKDAMIKALRDHGDSP